VKTVYVGLSGGVDSAVAAYLLKQQDYNVVGVYMKNWSRDIGGHTCPWQEDLASARTVSAHLQIPLKIFDFEKQYFESVAEYMIETYKKGQTPNPDIMCNEKIKFDAFYEKCIADGVDYISTGHYAKIITGGLAMATDKTKDQTYFLYRINPKVAGNVIFPLSDLTKKEVRAVAEKINLPNHDRADSQGLCFVGNIPMRDFLSEFIKPQKGKIIDDSGNELAEHNGAFLYTIGQRHGLGIGGGQPYYVYAIDTAKNIVRVTSDEDSALLNKKEFDIADCKWWVEPKEAVRYMVRVRYRSELKPATIHPKGRGRYSVSLQQTERAIAPGQSAVFYDGDTVVGGGIIS
jgi:tRNA-specific 2-thiouridylase